MFSGKQFRLERAILGVVSTDTAKRQAITVPSGAIIQIASGPGNGNGMVIVTWEGQTLEMFLVDVTDRGTEIGDRNAKA